MKQNIAVIFGGVSAEAHVSIVTALQAMDALDSTRYIPIPLYIDSMDGWLTGDGLLDRRCYPSPLRAYQEMLQEGVSLSAKQPQRPIAANLRSNGLFSWIRSLKERSFFRESLPSTIQRCQWIKLNTRGDASKSALKIEKQAPNGAFSRFRSDQLIKIDAALIACHGNMGETGQLQGFLESLGVPYTGLGVRGVSIAMDKALMKQLVSTAHQFSSIDLKYPIHVLDQLKLERPQRGRLIEMAQLQKLLDQRPRLKLPLCVKPCHMGSSIGVGVARSLEQLQELLIHIFQYDTAALVEPYLSDIIEYNVAVRRCMARRCRESKLLESKLLESRCLESQGGSLRKNLDKNESFSQQEVLSHEVLSQEVLSQEVLSQDRIVCSHIESPLRGEELLDFAQKYRQGGNKQGFQEKFQEKFQGGFKTMKSDFPGTNGTVAMGSHANGLATMQRTLDPELDPKLEEEIRACAETAFRLLGCEGAPRIDFIYDRSVKRLYFNEINPCPGSFGYYLWPELGFTQLLTHLIEEAFNRTLGDDPRFRIGDADSQKIDPVPQVAKLFRRSSTDGT